MEYKEKTTSNKYIKKHQKLDKLNNTQLSTNRNSNYLNPMNQTNSKKRVISTIDNNKNYYNNKSPKHNKFLFTLCDLNEYCSFCSINHKPNNHCLKFCSFICTNQKCLDTEVHCRAMCQSDDKNKLEKIDYTTSAFLIHKFIL